MLDGRYAGDIGSPLHDRLRSGGIADIIVFNFDRSLRARV
jgi:hypothetical protein